MKQIIKVKSLSNLLPFQVAFSNSYVSYLFAQSLQEDLVLKNWWTHVEYQIYRTTCKITNITMS